MWKSLCVAIIIVYFIPSSDAACDNDALSEYFGKVSKIESMLKDLKMDVSELRKGRTWRDKVNTWKLLEVAVSTTSLDRKPDIITLYLNISISAVFWFRFDAEVVPLSVTLIVRIANDAVNGFSYCGAEIGGCRRRKFESLNEVEAVPISRRSSVRPSSDDSNIFDDAETILNGIIRIDLLDVYEPRLKNFVKQMNEDPALKDACS